MLWQCLKKFAELSHKFTVKSNDIKTVRLSFNIITGIVGFNCKQIYDLPAYLLVLQIFFKHRIIEWLEQNTEQKYFILLLF